MHIFLGSTNRVKINAVTLAASETWPSVKVIGVNANSEVSDQPWGDEETRIGAENRAKAALEEGKRQKLSDEFIGIGMEGGVFEEKNGELWNTVWTAIVDTEGNLIVANGERFLLPLSLSKLIREGKEMGPAMDELIGSKDIKHQHGMIGVITKRFIDRTEMYAGLAKLALGLWYGRDWEKQR
jgi:inosine/xanthosine triphosphatase